MPIGGVRITATSDASTGEAISDSSGFFKVTLNSASKPGMVLTLSFRHPDYQPVTEHLFETALGQIYIARMTPLTTAAAPQDATSPIAITDVSVRYSIKSTNTVNIGSFAKIFEVENTGSLPCDGHFPCSPDGKWRAATGTASFAAGGDNTFVDVRVSCIAGPCPFTKIDSENPIDNGRAIKVVALNWSETATFLVEAEVTRTVISDLIRHSYPVIFGDGMNFTLPPTAEGLTIEAELNGAPIVFPPGPDLILSWATCTVKDNADRSRLYRCELKPGYEYR